MRILVGVTSPDCGRAEIELIARLKFANVELMLVNVNDYIDVAGYSSFGYLAGDFSLQYMQAFAEAGREALKEATSYAEKKGFKAIKNEIIEGYVANQIMVAADKWDVDLIGVSSRSNSKLAHFFSGSTTRKLLASAQQSLLITRPNQKSDWTGRAVFAVDHSKYNQTCIDHLVALAPQGLKSIRLLTALPPKQLEKFRKIESRLSTSATVDVEAALKKQSTLLAKRFEPLGCTIEQVLIVDDIHSAIAKEMQVNGGADLLIMGAQGHGYLERVWLGSTSFFQATHADYPVLILRPSIDAER